MLFYCKKSEKCNLAFFVIEISENTVILDYLDYEIESCNFDNVSQDIIDDFASKKVTFSVCRPFFCIVARTQTRVRTRVRDNFCSNSSSSSMSCAWRRLIGALEDLIAAFQHDFHIEEYEATPVLSAPVHAAVTVSSYVLCKRLQFVISDENRRLIDWRPECCPVKYIQILEIL